MFFIVFEVRLVCFFRAGNVDGSCAIVLEQIEFRLFLETMSVLFLLLNKKMFEVFGTELLSLACTSSTIRGTNTYQNMGFIL